jgi:uncharacterized protein (TIGR02270 family)
MSDQVVRRPRSFERSFRIRLYEEHLEEASFLHSQRQGQLTDPEIPWSDLAEVEDRIEPHIDGLVLGGEVALEVLRARDLSKDIGELHAGTSVLCRLRERELVFDLLESLDPSDAASIDAASDAICSESPPEWEPDFVRELSRFHPIITAVACRLIAKRRIPVGPDLLSLIRRVPDSLLVDMVAALGALRLGQARAMLSDLITHGAHSVRRASAIALLQLGDLTTAKACARLAENESWALIPAGLGGGPEALAAISRNRRSDDSSSEWITALGLFGEASAIPILIGELELKEHAEAAAGALQLISGATLQESVFVPDAVEELALHPVEAERFKEGEPPKRADGREYGTEKVQISRKPDEWGGWWGQARETFKPATRYCYAEPCTPASVFRALDSTKTDKRLRELCFLELEIRYGVQIPFETTMSVSTQMQALHQLRGWIEENGSRFQGGRWYLGGRFIA